MSSVHGHQVLEMMIASEHPYSTASLIEAINQRFGTDARFHTCSKQDLTAAELVDFLASKGKFIPADDGFTTHVDKICNH
ncbi:YecH family protein [Budviciaceae bacterium BWR-B9]|uniref:YecH family protein n=1 Tax=Limnobaculum allomyrinae TaxID=2791986 RepID=A0ABS1ISZ9_9GAMM|nr:MULTISPECIES: YecH family metal-binding protein [Limnobaculum]MBK5144884.1 YecH family protein [Limnobaculum allomyrinae]MBV7692547.1 YecH family protein [Limnobaculum sp. M2-1]